MQSSCDSVQISGGHLLALMSHGAEAIFFANNRERVRLWPPANPTMVSLPQASDWTKHLGAGGAWSIVGTTRQTGKFAPFGIRRHLGVPRPKSDRYRLGRKEKLTSPSG